MPAVQYEEVAARLRRAILAGEYQPGQRLPTERRLCELLVVSRITIRQALAILAQERLIERRQGSGTYICPRASRRIPLQIDYTGSMRQHAPQLTRALRCMAWRQPDPLAADELAVSPDEQLLCAERTDALEDGQIVAWDEATFAAWAARQLDGQTLARVDFIEAWTRAEGFELQSCRQSIEARQADARDAAILGMTIGEPVLISTELYLATDQRPAGFFISHYHPHHICIQTRYQWQVDAVQPAPGG